MKHLIRLSAAMGFLLALLAGRTMASVGATSHLPVHSHAIHQAPLIVHEWGTFTSLQDGKGHAIGGINTDDEPVPTFVHDLLPGLIAALGKGVPSDDPSVTMRLETPVLYFYPPQRLIGKTVDVFVKFRGGWLSQFYPAADCIAPGVVIRKGVPAKFGPITTDTVGSLHWSDLTLGVAPGGPKTTDPVWTAPRRVNAAYIKAANGEVERFLFYRGVGHINAPLRAIRKGHSLSIQAATAPPGSPQIAGVAKLWLADFRSNGTCAFRTIADPRITPGANRQITLVPSHFAQADFSRKNLAKLRLSMHQELVTQGLYPNEADALLNTWQASYFKSGGERLFFIVPRPWTNYFLPLKITPRPLLTRVMMGRIEIITQRQRLALAQLFNTVWDKGNLLLADRDIKVLGRFATALLHRQARRIHHGLSFRMTQNHQIASSGKGNIVTVNMQ